jgi:hypothetical protein
MTPQLPIVVIARADPFFIAVADILYFLTHVSARTYYICTS